MSEIIRTEEMSVRIDAAQILHDISLDVESGECVGLLGRNGAGKTSTFRAIMGELPITGGELFIKGENYTDRPIKQRAREGLSYCPQGRRLFYEMSVRDNLQLSIWGSGEDPPRSEVSDRIDDVIGIFPEMEEFLERDAGQLSGGQQQMVTVSRALVTEPDLILLDEPFEGLAPAVRERLANGLEEVKELGISLLIAESNIKYAEKVIDRGYIIDRGEMQSVYDGSNPLVDDPAIKEIFEEFAE